LDSVVTAHQKNINIIIRLIKSFFLKAITVLVAAFFVLKDGLQDVPKKSLKKAHCIFSGFMINKIPTLF